MGFRKLAAALALVVVIHICNGTAIFLSQIQSTSVILNF